jgi:capsular exopolysaccharide synthesis family protein
MRDEPDSGIGHDSQRPLRLASTARATYATQVPVSPSPSTSKAPGWAPNAGHLVDYLRVLHKRRWTATTTFIIVLVGTMLYVFTATPIYEARTRLLIESDNPNVVSFKEVIDEQGAKADYYQTQYNILQSRILARKTLDRLGLWENVYFGGPARKPGFIVRMFGGRSEQPRPASEETAEQARAIDHFLANLTVSPIRNSRLVDLKFRLPDAVLATRVVNTLATNYIEQNLEYKFMASKEASDWLNERLNEQRKQVERSEVALQHYREQNDAIPLEHRENIVIQKLADLNAAVTQAKTERFQKQALYNQLESLRRGSNALDSFPAILSNTYIQQQKADLAQLQSQYTQLSEKLGDRHPEMIKVRSAIQLAEAKLDGEVAKVVQSVRNEYLAALAKENSLINALTQQKAEAQAMNRKSIDDSVLERDVQSSKQIYDSLLQRAKETGVSTELRTSNIRIVDRAEQPRAPIQPRKMLSLLLALTGGFGLSLVLAFFFEYLDSSLKSPDEIRAYLGLPTLGMVPALNPKTWKGREPLINAGVPPNFAEAFRAMRTNVLFSVADDGPRSLVITSTGPGEGKSIVAANLAIGFAQAGQRVILIDADMRRPRVHEIFAKKQEPGLSNFLVGHTVASSAIRKSPVPGLWLLTAGRIPPNPAELIGSQRFKKFIELLGQYFDSIVIDSPPIMAVTDPALAANAATGIVFVVGAEMTSRHAARTAIEQLDKGRSHFVGAVLNRVELERNAYYYSGYYRREYAKYYQTPRAVGGR